MEDFLFSMEWVVPLRRPWATPLAEGLTWLGYTPFFLIFLPIGYWLWDRGIFTRLTVIVAVSAVLNGWLKDFWQDARPPAELRLDGRVEGSPGRPSGHAQVAFAMWLWLAYEINRPWAWAAGIALAVGVAASRLYLGVHDVDDVLAGAALGLATVAVFAWLLRTQPGPVAWLRARPAAQIALVMALTPVLWAIWPRAVDAAGAAIHSGPAPTLTVLFLLGGWLAGAAMDAARDAARDAGAAPAPRPASPRPAALWRKLAMVALGIPGLFALRWAIETGGAALDLPPALVSFAGAAILGFYMTGLAPALFRALGLMPAR